MNRPDHYRQAEKLLEEAEAESIVRSITDEFWKPWALRPKAVAATDPNRAGRLITDAERIARSITGESSKASALSGVVQALAAADPNRVERIAHSIRDKFKKAQALSGIAKALAAMSS